jgi:hypothetical protein
MRQLIFIKIKLYTFSGIAFFVSQTLIAQKSQDKDLKALKVQKMEAVNFSQVQINDNFWKQRMDKVSTVTIPLCIEQTEVKTPRIRNFEKVARKEGEKHEGIY